MVLENDAVYHAIQVATENGYWVIDETAGTIILVIGTILVFVIGFIAGWKEAKKEKEEEG